MIAFSIGSIHVYWYGIMYFLSFLLGYGLLYYGQKQWWYKGFDADIVIGKDLDGLILAILIGVMLWGRLGHVFIYDWSYFMTHPLKILAFQEGGMSFIGGIIGVVVSMIIYLYYFSPLNNINNKDILSVFDAMIPIVPIGIFFGRFGNFLNQELYGRVVAQSQWLSGYLVELLTRLDFFYVYETIDTQLRVNTNFLSMLFEWLLIAIVLWILFFKKVVTKKRYSWQLSSIFLGLYSSIRFVLEYVRQDSQTEFVGRFTRSQRFFLLFFIMAVIEYILLAKKKNL